MKHIESESQYKEIMARIEELLPLIAEDTPEDDVNSMELVRLSILVEDYEKGILDFDIDQEFLIRDKVKV